MLRFLKSKVPGLIIMILACMIFVCIVLLTVKTYTKTLFMETPYMFLEGEYRVDDGEWKPIDRNEPINETFRHISFRGTVPESILDYVEQITVTSKNVWITMCAEDGTSVFDNKYTGFEELTESYWQEGMDRNSPELQQDYNDYADMLKEKYPFYFDMPGTPGYFCVTIDTLPFKTVH